MQKSWSAKLKRINYCIESISPNWEFLIIAVIATTVVFGVVIVVGTINCGFHVIDDHQFAEWVYQMKYQGMSVFEIIFEKLREDLYTRYEPLYYTTRILSCYLFGINLTALSILKAAEIVIDIVLLYYCGRELGAAKIHALLFSMISMVGYQSAVWWKLGPQEAQCTMLFAAGFYCMLRWLRQGKKSWMTGSIILFLLMVNYKESYILLIPFLMLYVLYYDLSSQGGTVTIIKVLEGIKRYLWYLLVLGLLFVIPVVIILTCVGVNNYGMVGLDATAPIDVYRQAMENALNTDLKWFKRFGILFFLILLTYWDELKKLWKEMLLTVIFLLPQVVIFGRTGITERYILPSSIAYAYFFVLIILKWKPLAGKRRIVYILGLVLLLTAHGRVAIREADYFRFRGESITTMLETVREMADDDINVLSCFRPNEEGNLTMNFWMKVHDFDNVYYWTEADGTITRECDINRYYSEDEYLNHDFEDMDIVVMYNKEDRHWCYTPTLDLSDFVELPCGTLTIYVRNNSVDQIIKPHVEGLRINI